MFKSIPHTEDIHKHPTKYNQNQNLKEKIYTDHWHILNLKYGGPPTAKELLLYHSLLDIFVFGNNNKENQKGTCSLQVEIKNETKNTNL